MSAPCSDAVVAGSRPAAGVESESIECTASACWWCESGRRPDVCSRARRCAALIGQRGRGIQEWAVTRRTDGGSKHAPNQRRQRRLACDVALLSHCIMDAGLR